jgi:hypothetical protein
VRASTFGFTRIAVGPRRLVKRLQLRHGFDVELENSRGETRLHLGRGLADPGEDDPRGRHAGGQRARKLARGNDVRSGAECGQGLDHRLGRIRLEGKADGGVEAGQRLPECSIAIGEGGCRVAVEGRADAVGDARERRVFRVQDMVAISEGAH